VKTVLKQEPFLNIVRSNLKAAIGQALQEITIHDLKEFCVAMVPALISMSLL
jgi:hypothetical protein